MTFGSIWLIFVVTFVVSIGSVEAGYWWARKKRRADIEKEAPVGAMVGAVLGLLAFLLAITFGIAADTYLARKRVLIDEANAIRTAYMRAALIAEPHRSAVRAILREYVDQRLHWGGVDLTKEPARSAKELLAHLWSVAETVGQENPNSEAVALFVQSVNEVEDLHHQRLLLRERTRIPGAFWAVLYLVAVLGLGAMGYHCGVSGTVRSPVMITVALAFSIVIVLIVDVDRPAEGLVVTNQQAMVDVRAAMTP